MKRYDNKVFSPAQFKADSNSQKLMSDRVSSGPQPNVFRGKVWPLAVAAVFLLIVLAFILL